MPGNTDSGRRAALTLLLGTALLTGGCFGGAPPRPLPDEGPSLPVAQRPNFSGTWTLDTGASDDLDDAAHKLDAELRAAQAASGGPTPLPQSGPATDPLHRPGRPFGDIRGFSYASRTLRIQHTDPTLRIATDDGDTQVFQTDQRGSTISATGAVGQQVSVAGWEGAAIVIETTGGNGVGLTRRYRLRDGGARLEVETEFDLARIDKTVLVTQRYRRAAAAPP